MSKKGVISVNGVEIPDAVAQAVREFMISATNGDGRFRCGDIMHVINGHDCKPKELDELRAADRLIQAHRKAHNIDRIGSGPYWKWIRT